MAGIIICILIKFYMQSCPIYYKKLLVLDKLDN